MSEIDSIDMSRGMGTVQKKVVLLLLGGMVLGLSRSPRKYFQVLREIGKEWQAIDRRALHIAIKKLYASRLIAEQIHEDGSVTIVLSEAGKRRALRFKLEEMAIKKPKAWDGKWRVIIFDVPERKRRVRDAFRGHLRQMDFYELQKSVFVHPHPCADETEFLTEFYGIHPYVRQMTVEMIDNELHLKKLFRLL